MYVWCLTLNNLFRKPGRSFNFSVRPNFKYLIDKENLTSYYIAGIVLPLRDIADIVREICRVYNRYNQLKVSFKGDLVG